MNNPAVTVFMAVFNGEAYIAESIKSVIAQSFTDFELLIVNDGSTDRTSEIIAQFNDPRIRVLQNESNKGLTYTRNYGAGQAKSKYFAILDSDDIAMPNRLEIQFNFMSTHPDICLCGGQSILIDQKGNQTGNMSVISGYEDMASELIFQNIFINSTLMIRRDALLEAGGYRDLAPAEDYDLSFRISLKYQIANLDEVLVAYRIHDNNISSRQAEKQGIAERMIIKNMHNALQIQLDENLINLHHQLMYHPVASIPTLDYFHLLKVLKQGNLTSKRYPINTFNRMLFNKWFNLLRERKEKKILFYYFRKPLFERTFVTFKQLRRAFKQSVKESIGG